MGNYVTLELTKRLKWAGWTKDRDKCFDIIWQDVHDLGAIYTARSNRGEDFDDDDLDDSEQYPEWFKENFITQYLAKSSVTA
jgi:hypothetical protein